MSGHFMLDDASFSALMVIPSISCPQFLVKALIPFMKVLPLQSNDFVLEHSSLTKLTSIHFSSFRLNAACFRKYFLTSQLQARDLYAPKISPNVPYLLFICLSY